MTSKAYFIISTYGRTATQWLHQVLNQHPEIFCTHSSDLSILPPSPETPQERNIRVSREHEAFAKISLDEYFDKMERLVPGKKAYGNVHGIDALEDFSPYRRKFTLIHLLRHPIHRVQSLVSRWLHATTYLPEHQERLWLRFQTYAQDPFIANLLQEHEVDLKVKANWLFVVAVFRLQQDLKHFQLPIPHVPMERLVKDLDYFFWLLAKITQGQVSLTEEYIDDLYQAQPVDQRNRKVTALEQFDSWPEWQKVLFIRAIYVMKSLNYYDILGYDLSFCLPYLEE